MSAVYTFDEALPIAPGAPEGPAAGGTEVIISGKSLGECSVIEPEGSAPLYPRGCENVLVSFGSEPGLVLAAEGEKIAVFAPAHAPGTVDVTVTTPAGTSALSAADRFIYTGDAPAGGSGALPAVNDVSPREGPAAGFTEVTIKGEHLLPEGAGACVVCAGVVVRFGAVAVPVLEGGGRHTFCVSACH